MLVVRVFENWPKCNFLQFCCAYNSDETDFILGGSLVYICRTLCKKIELNIPNLNNLTTRVKLAPFANFRGVVMFLHFASTFGAAAQV